MYVTNGGDNGFFVKEAFVDWTCGLIAETIQNEYSTYNNDLVNRFYSDCLTKSKGHWSSCGIDFADYLVSEESKEIVIKIIKSTIERVKGKGKILKKEYLNEFNPDWPTDTDQRSKRFVRMLIYMLEVINGKFDGYMLKNGRELDF